MSATSKIRIVKKNDRTESMTFTCAQDIKSIYSEIKEYSYIPISKTKKEWERWIKYLVDMGLKLEIQDHKYDLKIKIVLTDLSQIQSGSHLLWMHGLIRMISEPESGFKNFVNYVYKLRENEKLKHFDNYQIMQIALMFENTVTNDSNGYTHFPMGTVRNNGVLPVKLITFSDVGFRFSMFKGELGIGETAILSASTMTVLRHLKSTISTGNSSEVASKLIKFKDYERVLLTIKQIQENIDKYLDNVLEYFDKLKDLETGTLAICTNIGSKSTLIKGNIYRIQKFSRNKKLITINDAWGTNITTRHFKIIM